MSRESVRNESVNAEVKETEETKFEIVNKEPSEFDFMSKTYLMKSSKLCSLVNQIFKEIYDDYEGSKFEVGPTGELILTLWFNHKIYDDTDKIVAFSKNSDVIECKNELVGKIKARSRISKMGDRYNITKYGKEGLDKFISRNNNVRNGKGEVIWDRCYTDVTDPQLYYNSPQAQKIYTKVSHIDIASILKFKYGNKVVIGVDTNNKKIKSKVKYSVCLHAAPVNPGFGGYNKDCVLKIEQINEEVLNSTLEDLGLGGYTSCGIIK